MHYGGVWAVPGFIAVEMSRSGDRVNVQPGRAESRPVPCKPLGSKPGNESFALREKQRQSQVTQSTKWPRPKEKVVLITCSLYYLSKREGGPFHITCLPSNGSNKQIRVDGLDNARTLPHTCTIRSKGRGFSSNRGDSPVSRLHYANGAALTQTKLQLLVSRCSAFKSSALTSWCWQPTCDQPLLHTQAGVCCFTLNSSLFKPRRFFSGKGEFLFYALLWSLEVSV